MRKETRQSKTWRVLFCYQKKQKSMLFGTLEPKRVGWVERSGTQQQLTVVVKILVTLPERSKDFRFVRSNRFSDLDKTGLISEERLLQTGKF